MEGDKTSLSADGAGICVAIYQNRSEVLEAVVNYLEGCRGTNEWDSQLPKLSHS